ncbi:MAG: B12-binding domain-containing radical SAM protein [Desulfococcaceae bacterium]
MKILLVMPDAGIHKIRIFGRDISFRDAPLTLAVLAARIPPELDVELVVVDESVRRLPKRADFDLVGISCLTGTAFRAYDLARFYRKHGARIVLGGVHVTLRPEEAARHADAVVTGFAEHAWPELLRDFASGRMKPRYHGGNPELDGMTFPRRDVQNRHQYLVGNSVFATRGCKGVCEFCSIPAAHVQWRTRPVGEVIDEIRSLPGRRFGFNDVSLTEDRNYALELFRAVEPLKRTWGGLATSRIGEDDELLDAMAESGCQFLLLGLESASAESLAGIGKGFNRVDRYHSLVEKLHDRGICIQGCFIFGMEADGPSVFRETVELVNDLGIDIPRYAVFTPYPGTRAHQRLQAEGRLLHEYWPHYDTQHVVFQPARMSPEALDAGFRRAFHETYSLSAVRRRCRRSPRPAITFLGNLAYRRYLRRLESGYRIHHVGAAA